MWWLLACTPGVVDLPPADTSEPPTDSDAPIEQVGGDTAPPETPGWDWDEWARPPVLLLTVGDEILLDVKRPGTLQVITEHDGTLDDLAQAPVALELPIGVEWRGNSSTSFPKHSYNLELRDETGVDADAELLGLPAESDWVLFGPYTDKTYLRNPLAYALARQTGQYAPRTVMIELLIDGSYQGVYVLTEKIKRGRDRVDIAAVAAIPAEGDITGGYIFKREGSGEIDGWSSAQGNYYNYQYPQTADLTDAQRDYLHDYVDAFEAMMAGPDFATEYPNWIDVDSFVDYSMILELSHNVDGYRKSAYLHKDADSDGGLLHAGPVWDFDISFGNADYCQGADDDGFIYENDCAYEIPSWWVRLMQEPAFQERLRCRWAELRQDVLSEDALVATLAELGENLGDAQVRDQEVWRTMGVYVWPNAYIGQNYADEIGYLQGWVIERALWLDGAWAGCAG